MNVKVGEKIIVDGQEAIVTARVDGRIKCHCGKCGCQKKTDNNRGKQLELHVESVCRE